MKTGLCKLLATILIVPMLLFGGVSVIAQTTDSDMVSVVVSGWECPLLQTPDAEVANFASEAKISEFRLAQTGEDVEPTPFGPGSCPTPTPGPDNGTVPSPRATSTATSTIPTEATETPVAVSTNSVGGFGSTVPVVAQLPETGTSPEGASSHWMLATMLTAGILLTVGGLLNSRTDQ